jgi:glucose-6-phosphate 1-dehydrogenase
MSDAAFRNHMREAVAEFARLKIPSPQVWERFAQSLYYVAGDPTGPDLYMRLRQRLEEMERARGGASNRIFYSATPPSLYDDIVGNLGEAGLAHSQDGWTRIVIEKPFGRDLESGRALNRQLISVFDEEQIYRIDHYLGKETVQNILVFRFANGIFEPVWNRNHVAEVQITVAESIGVEGRGSYYEESGALRDMVQNHLLQLLCLIAMEPPVTFDAGPVRDEKNKALQAVRPIDPAKVDEVALRAQYAAGHVGGKQVPGYRQEKGVKPDSTTETYAALRLTLDNWRWAGVPFYLRTGKRLGKRVSEIVIRFRRTPHMIFRRSDSGLMPNMLIIRIQPDEGISLTVAAKEPGPDLKLGPVTLDFKYSEVFGGEPPEAYERLLLDVIHGDATLYARGDWVEHAWALLQPVIEAWSRTPAALPTYEAGSWGPAEAEPFIARDGGAWREP